MEKSLLEQGQKIYQRICVNCHGETGKGDGVSAGFLPVLPRDFTNCRFQRKRTDGELFYVIKFGSWPMPPMVPSISENEAWIVIPYIRTFCKN
ncbi:MAG: c-type cytochrome [Nitrospirales bacterium]|nr:cytochrome c [Nitrospira sp.]MDR4501184.1 c-type cytochrome [Nitrospirales bacterium]